MFLLLLVFIFGLTSGTFIKRSELERYTQVASTIDGSPCLGGCSPITNKCVVNWLWMKKPCQTENQPAPIFYTSQQVDKENKVCWSNCGKFGSLYEWCVTAADNKWDFCSSQLRGAVPTAEGRNHINSYTKDKQLCQTPCVNNNNNGYLCHLNKIFWNYCSKPAISRIPILPPDYKVGLSEKRNCEAFLTNLVRENFRANVSFFDLEYIPDNFLQETAETIETALKFAPESGVFKDVSNEGSALKNYTMTNMFLDNGTVVLVPAVVRAFVSNKTIRHNQPLIDLRVMEERNRNRRRRQLAYDDDGYFNWRIIGYELGGTDEDYNFFRQSPNLYESWLQIQRAISVWCGNTGGSVEILTVIYYADVKTVLPKALGASLTFYNPDGNVFVSCKDTVYWNK